MGLLIRSVTGDEGQVELVGVRAVIGIFLKWTLERRGETPSGAPSWTLRAVFSYQKDSLLTSGQRKRIRIKFPPKGPWYELEPAAGSSYKITQDRLVIEEVTLCQVEEPSK